MDENHAMLHAHLAQAEDERDQAEARLSTAMQALEAADALLHWVDHRIEADGTLNMLKAAESYRTARQRLTDDAA